MIQRTYVCLMPDNGAVNLDIAVETAPGTQAVPVGTGGAAASAANGAYYEWRGRTLRFPVRAAAGAAGGFSPRARLGFALSLNRWGATALEVPGVVLSASFINTLDSGGAAIINPADVADPAAGPVLRLVNSANLVGQLFVVHLSIFEDKDEDRSDTGN